MTEHPPTREGTLLEREAARVIRNAVSDFERETLSLSAVEYLLRRIGNVADILDRSDRCRTCGAIDGRHHPECPSVASGAVVSESEKHAQFCRDRATEHERKAATAPDAERRRWHEREASEWHAERLFYEAHARALAVQS